MASLGERYDQMTRPRLLTGTRLVYEEARGEHVLLVPEGVLRLNTTAAEVLQLCDGERSLDEIVSALSARYDNADLRDDVRELVDGMIRRGLLADAAASTSGV
jgi:pyrroloquinoline quinone biosynthesis protein D